MPFETLTWVYHDAFKVKKQAFQYQMAATAGVDPVLVAIIPAKTGYRIRITDVWFNCGTSAAKTWTIRDDATTPVVLCIIAPSIGVGTHAFPFGSAGIAATVSKNVDLLTDGAGYAGTLLVEGFYEPIGPFTPATL